MRRSRKTRLTKVARLGFGWIAKKTGFAILSSLPEAVTGKKVRIPNFRETPEDNLRLLAVASYRTVVEEFHKKNSFPLAFLSLLRYFLSNKNSRDGFRADHKQTGTAEMSRLPAPAIAGDVPGRSQDKYSAFFALPDPI